MSDDLSFELAFEPAAPPSFADLAALVVDDIPHMVMLLTSMLRTLGFKEIVSADTVVAAHRLLPIWNPGIVFVDWVMEPVDGLELVKIIRSGVDVPNRYVPILMITGHADANRVREAREAGADAFIVKPFSGKLLAKRITAVLQEEAKHAAHRGNL
jgi:two-component system, chemotaxis family, chemotaxis protein CheY